MKNNKNTHYSYSSIICNLLFLSIFVSLAFNYRINQDPSIFFSNVVILILLIMIFLYLLINKKKIFISNYFIISIILILYSLIGIENASFFINFSKIAFIILNFYIFSLFFRSSNVDVKNMLLAYSLGLFISIFYSTNYRDLTEIGYAQRLMVLDLGNYNVYGFLLSVSIISLLFLIKNSRSIILKIAFFLISLQQLVILFTTFSRGGFLSLLVGIASFSYLFYKKSVKYFILNTLLFILIFYIVVITVTIFNADVLVQRLFLLDDPTGSGRKQLYSFTLNKLFEYPLWLVWGTGLGSASFFKGFDFYVETAHNTYIDILIEFGLAWFSIFIFFLINTYKKINIIENSSDKNILKVIFIQITFSFLYDSYYGATQIGWLLGLFFALFWNYSSHHSKLNNVNNQPMNPAPIKIP